MARRAARHPSSSKLRRIVLTGGPGGGKTTAADLFHREIGARVVVVPEAASMLFRGGFPRDPTPSVRRAAQRAIYFTQINLELAYAAAHPGRILICDRGTLDGLAYWPGRPEEFLTSVGTNAGAELARYEAVLFFESAAVGGLRIESPNPARVESEREMAALDKKLRRVWENHGHFHLVPHSTSFVEKISFGLALLQGLVREMEDGAGSRRRRHKTRL